MPNLGNFSVSLAVKDLAASRAFYEKLGFGPISGDGKRWQILKNGSTLIGLFQGMFPSNTLTFNPAWDANGNRLPEFTDVHELRRQARAAGIPVEGDDSAKHFMVIDPDGNPILIDQHV